MKRIILCVLLVIAALLFCFWVQDGYGTTYYVSKSGSDDSTGLTWARAKLTIPTISAGDTVRFGSGRWLNTQINPPTGGSYTLRTVYACSTFSTASQGLTQIISGDSVPKARWVNHSGQIYKANFTPNPSWSTTWGDAADICWNGVQNDSLLTSTSSLSNVNVAGRFYYNATTDTVWLWCFNGGNPNTREILLSHRPTVNLCYAAIKNVLFFGLTLKMGRDGVVLWHNHNSDSIFFVHCKIEQMNNYDSENSSVIHSRDGYEFGDYNSFIACSLGWVTNENGGTCGSGTNMHSGSVVNVYDQGHMLFDSCYFYHAFGEGIIFKEAQATGDGYNVGSVVRNSYFDTSICDHGINFYRKTDRDSVYGCIFNGMKTPAIAVNWGSTTDNLGEVFIGNNTFYNCHGYIWARYSDVNGGNKAKYNVGYKTTTGFLSYNRFLDFCYDGTGNPLSSWSAIDSNYWYDPSNAFTACNFSTGNYTWSTWQSAGYDAHGHNSDPGLKDPANGDFSRPDASGEMNVTYGGRTWTIFGAEQPALKSKKFAVKRVH